MRGSGSHIAKTPLADPRARLYQLAVIYDEPRWRRIRPTSPANQRNLRNSRCGHLLIIGVCGGRRGAGGDGVGRPASSRRPRRSGSPGGRRGSSAKAACRSSTVISGLLYSSSPGRWNSHPQTPQMIGPRSSTDSATRTRRDGSQPHRTETEEIWQRNGQSRLAVPAGRPYRD